MDLTAFGSAASGSGRLFVLLRNHLEGRMSPAEAPHAASTMASPGELGTRRRSLGGAAFIRLALALFIGLTSLLAPTTAPARPLTAAVPGVSLAAPGSVFIGDSFGFTVTFDNTDADTGYGPFIDPSDGTLGPFRRLRELAWGDRVTLVASGSRHTFEVRQVRRVWPDDLSVLWQEEYDWPTLITCESHDATNDNYRYRLAVRAALVEVEPLSPSEARDSPTPRENALAGAPDGGGSCDVSGAQFTSPASPRRWCGLSCPSGAGGGHCGRPIRNRCASRNEARPPPTCNGPAVPSLESGCRHVQLRASN